MNEPQHRGRPLAVVRAEIMESAEAKELAKTFGVSLDEYAALVLDYVQDPTKEPVLETIDTEDADEEGVPYASASDVQRWLEGAASGALTPTPVARDGFTHTLDDHRARRSVGVVSPPLAPRPGDQKAEVIVLSSPLGSVLRDQVRGQRERALAGSRRAK